MTVEGFPLRSVVILNLVNPREKFWGIMASLSAVGVTLRGINLDSFDDWVHGLVRADRDDENLDLVTMFVPLFRIERIFLDERVGAVESYHEKFIRIVGMTIEEWTTKEDSQ